MLNVGVLSHFVIVCFRLSAGALVPAPDTICELSTIQHPSFPFVSLSITICNPSLASAVPRARLSFSQSLSQGTSLFQQFAMLMLLHLQLSLLKYTGHLQRLGRLVYHDPHI